MRRTKFSAVKRVFAALLAASSLLSFSSCAAFDLNAENLMTPPRPDKQQEEIRSALALALGTDAFSLRTPRGGSQQTAVFYQDLYGSPDYEAAILYSLDSSHEETRVHVLTRGKETAWDTVCDFNIAAGSAVERLEFASVDPTGYAQMLIGTTLYSGRENVLTVWEVDTGKPEEIFSTPYSRMLSGDLDGDEKDEIITFNTLADGSGTSVNMMGYNETDGTIAVESTEMLDVQFASWLQVTTGTLGTGSQAIFIDGRTEAESYATEVIAVISGQLVKVLTSRPTRNIPVTCRDIDGDGSPEVPVQEIMPGYADAAATDRIPRIDWSSCDAAGLTPRSVSTVNMKWNYILHIPTRLTGAVTVLSDEEDDLWTLCMWDVGKQATSRKILAIRSWIAREWDEKADLHPEQTVFARQDNICYTVEFYIEDMITFEELTELFEMI